MGIGGLEGKELDSFDQMGLLGYRPWLTGVSMD